MTAAERNLYKIDVGATKKIGGFDVTRETTDSFSINGEVLDAAGVLKFIQASKTTENEYDKLVYIFVKPHEPHRPAMGDKSFCRAKGRADVLRLINMALEKNLHLYYTTPVQREGKWYAPFPWIIEWDSVPDQVGNNSSRMACPFCKQPMSSGSGRTLHVKTKHPDRLQEYEELLASIEQSIIDMQVKSSEAAEVEKPVEEASSTDTPDDTPDYDSLVCHICGKKCTSKPGFTLHLKTHGAAKTAAKSESDSALVCKFCGKACSSTSGLTLHIKNKHS